MQTVNPDCKEILYPSTTLPLKKSWLASIQTHPSRLNQNISTPIHYPGFDHLHHQSLSPRMNPLPRNLDIPTFDVKDEPTEPRLDMPLLMLLVTLETEADSAAEAPPRETPAHCWVASSTCEGWWGNKLIWWNEGKNRDENPDLYVYDDKLNNGFLVLKSLI